MSEQVAFYCWIENQPSSLTVRIDGGDMNHTGGGDNDKMSVKTTLKEVRFNKGILRTSDEQTIATLRRLIKQGETITEDHELYLSKVTSVEQQAKRAVAKNAELVEENRNLRRRLEGQSKTNRPSRLGTKDAAKAAPAEAVPVA